MTDISMPVEPVTPIAPVTPDPTVPVGAAIVATPTTVAPLTTADGTPAFVVQVTCGNQNYQMANAASWTHNADGSLDIYDGNSNLIASYPTGQWNVVQLVPAPPPPVTPDA